MLYYNMYIKSKKLVFVQSARESTKKQTGSFTTAALLEKGKMHQ